MSLRLKGGQSQVLQITELSPPTPEEPPQLCSLLSCRAKSSRGETAGGRGTGGLR